MSAQRDKNLLHSKRFSDSGQFSFHELAVNRVPKFKYDMHLNTVGQINQADKSYHVIWP